MDSVQMTGKKTKLQIDVESPVAVYRQIVDGLRASLVEGELRPGDTLPSVRRLAIELGITFNTVALAYRELAEEGWLDLRHGRRAMVVERTAREGSSRERMEMFRRRLRELTAEMRAEGASAGALVRELRGLAERLAGS
jgi:GntR family transcriptional regulator